MTEQTHSEQPADPVSGTPLQPTGDAAQGSEHPDGTGAGPAGDPVGGRGEQGRTGVMPAVRNPRELFDMVSGGWPFGQAGWPWRDAWPWRDMAESGGHLIRVEECTEGGSRVVRAEIPGVDPKRDISVTVEDDTLVISARREEHTESHDPGSYRSEFRYGSFTRHVRLPRGTSPDVISASYRDGVLEVRLPLPSESPGPRTVPVSRG